MKKYRFTVTRHETTEFFVTAENEEQAKAIADYYDTEGELPNDVPNGCEVEDGNWSSEYEDSAEFQGEFED